MKQRQILGDVVLLMASAISAAYFLLLYACYHFQVKMGVLPGALVELFTIPMALTAAFVLVYGLFLVFARRHITIRLLLSMFLSALVVAAILLVR